MEKEQEYSVTYYAGERKCNGSPTIVALLTVTETGKQYRGVAHCNPTDTYNQAVGEKIAEARARKQYFKAQANEAIKQYEVAKRLLEATKKYAEKKAARHAREEKWLADYLKKV